MIAIERGPHWRNTATDYPPGYAADELRVIASATNYFFWPEQATFTFRNKMNQTSALPIRSGALFMPPNGVGGGGVHWNAETWR